MVLISLLNTFMTSRLVKNHLTNFALPKRLRPITDNRYPNLITRVLSGEFFPNSKDVFFSKLHFRSRMPIW